MVVPARAPKSLEQDQLDDLNLLTRYKPGDKFFVKKNGTLGITKSGFTQDIRRTVRNLTLGGCNRKVVADRFHALAEKIQDLDPGPTEDNIALLMQAANVFDAVSQSYKSNFLEKERPYSRLTTAAGTVRRSIEGASNLFGNKVSVLNYHNNNPDTLIKWYGNLPGLPPRELTLEDTARLLQAVKKRRPGIIRKIACKALAGTAVAVGVLPCTVLTIIKWVLCNPIEYLRKGEVTTRNPLMQLVERAYEISDNRKANDCDAKTASFSRWYFNILIDKEQISTEDVDALCDLPIGRVGDNVEGNFTLMVTSKEDIKLISPGLFDVIEKEKITIDFTNPISLRQVRSEVLKNQTAQGLEGDGKGGPQILAADFVRLERKIGVFGSGTAKEELKQCDYVVWYQKYVVDYHKDLDK